MKIFRLTWIFVVCGIAFGLMTVWSSAAPKTVDDVDLRGGTGWVFCNCTEAGMCSVFFSSIGCTTGYLKQCHPGGETHNRCDNTGNKGGNCWGPTGSACDTSDEPEQICFTES